MLVLSINRLDYSVMFNEWLPQYLRVLEAHTTNELDLEILGRIFQVCTMSSTDQSLFVREAGIYNKTFRQEQVKAFLTTIQNKDAPVDYSRESMLQLLYTVCCTSPYGVGFEAFCDVIFEEDENKKLVTVLDERMKTIAEEFALDLKNLHPLSKLKGINTNKESRSQLPNLDETTVDYADDLVMAVDELLNPPGDIYSSESWLRSRLRICAVAEIIKRLNELEQPDLVSICLSSLKAHAETLKDQAQPLEDYFNEYIELLVLMSGANTPS